MWDDAPPTPEDRYKAMLKARDTFLAAYAAWAAAVCQKLVPLLQANADAMEALARQIRTIQKQARIQQRPQRPRQRRNAPPLRRPPANWYRGGHKDNWIGGPGK